MVRNRALYLALGTSMVLAQQPPREIPDELHHNLVALRLQDIQISYKQGWPCIGVIGLDVRGYKKAYVALRYIGAGSMFHWTPFAEVPLNQRNDTFGVIYKENKVVVIQSDSREQHVNATGHHVELDRVTATVILRPIGAYRMPVEDDCWVRFNEDLQ